LAQAQQKVIDAYNRATVQQQSTSSSSSSHQDRFVSDENPDSKLEEDDENYTDENDNVNDGTSTTSPSRRPMVTDSFEVKRQLLNTGPHRWTPSTMTEYVEQYFPLEGKLWVHPRTKRLYEITHVFFYEKYQVAAAYSRVRDGGQPDPTDQYPHRIDGKLGLAELVEEFEKSGGSQGTSRTRWPRNENDWASLQEQDTFWGPIIKKLKAERQILLDNFPKGPERMSEIEKEAYNEEIKKVRSYGRERGKTLVYDGVLFITNPELDQKRLLYVVPQTLKQNVIEMFHVSRGHPGAERTTDTARLSYWWHGMVSDIDTHVRNCKSCARRKARNAVAAPPIQAYDGPSMPWERAHIDLTGPLTQTLTGMKYIVVVKDALTRYVETIPVPKNTAYEVAQAFVNAMIYRHGAVGTLISDNGREFDNTLWKQVTQLLNINHYFITPHNPRANGLAENHMRTMKDAIAIYCDETQEDWDQHLSGVTMSYNTTVNSQTGLTPYYMMYGREARLPTESWLREFSHVRGVLPYVSNLVHSLVQVWDDASSRKPEEVKRMIKGQKPIVHLKYADYVVGDYAMVRVVPKTNTAGWIDKKYRRVTLKLQPRYAGPYQITKKISEVVYVLEVDKLERVFHAVNMKPYSGKKDDLTPFVEPGYERLEAGRKRPPTPLLLSPDPTLNEAARVQFKSKNVRPKSRHQEKLNAEQERSARQQETLERQSQSPNVDDLWLWNDQAHFRQADKESNDDSEAESDDENEDEDESDELDDVEDDEDDDDDDDYTDEEITGQPGDVTSSKATQEQVVNQTQLLMTHPRTTITFETSQQTSISDKISVDTVNLALLEDNRIITQAWEHSLERNLMLTPEDVQVIMETADISTHDLDSDPERKLRIESWLRNIIHRDRQRRARVPKNKLEKEDKETPPMVFVGHELFLKDNGWYNNEHSNPLRKNRPSRSS